MQTQRLATTAKKAVTQTTLHIHCAYNENQQTPDGEQTLELILLVK